MQYETLLFTRNQREDFTAFIRPSLLTNKDVSAIGGVFNYVSDISRLTADFPSLYFYPQGEYLLVLRHYDSGRKHAGRAIGIIEGIAVRRGDSAEFARALPEFVEQQSRWLDVVGSVDDIELQPVEPAPEQVWTGQAPDRTEEGYIGDFLARREADRLFVPFTAEGRAMLVTTLCDARFTSPPFFAFGTNSDVLAQLDHRAPVDIVSFFKTESASFRSRKTNRVTQLIGAETEAADTSMSLRPVAPRDEMRLRPERVYERDEEADEDTLVGEDAVSIRAFRKAQPQVTQIEDEDDDSELTVLTMRQLRDRLRAEEAAAQETQPEAHKQPNDPIHWLLRLISSIVSPNRPK